MPVKLREMINEHTEIGVWEITEETDGLISRLDLSEKEQEVYESFVNEQRKKQWLSYRCLFKEILKDIPVHIEYDKNRKPFIRNHPCHISVSHAGNYSAVILSGRQKVGIDIEKISPRIEKIASRFVHPDEIHLLDGPDRLEKLYLIWGAKEALYKLYGKKELDFRYDIVINNFELKASGGFEGFVIKNNDRVKSELQYRFLNGYSLVYTAVTQE